VTCDKHLKGIPEKEFQESCEQQKHQLTEYTAARGDYFEGDMNY
jgi:hypothetical protein